MREVVGVGIGVTLLILGLVVMAVSSGIFTVVGIAGAALVTSGMLVTWWSHVGEVPLEETVQVTSSESAGATLTPKKKRNWRPILTTLELLIAVMVFAIALFGRSDPYLLIPFVAIFAITTIAILGYFAKTLIAA